MVRGVIKAENWTAVDNAPGVLRRLATASPVLRPPSAPLPLC